MHDIKVIREDPDGFDAALARRGLAPHAQDILKLDEVRRACQTRAQEAQTARNAASKKIGAAKAKGDDAGAQTLIDEVAQLKSRIQEDEEAERSAAEALDEELSGLPNALFDDVPEGEDDSANVEIRRVGEPPAFDFDVKEHDALGAALGLMDFEAAAAISGARFVFLKGALSRMERALGNFMLDLHTKEYGYTEVSPPLLVRDQAVFGTGQLPKFEEDLFRTDNGYWLVPTAEVPLTNMVRERILSADDLPMRLTAFTPCFRSEAGSAGKDTRGIVRLHQFLKVELVSITAPEESLAELERKTACAEEVLKRLGLAYRVVTLCSGDTGFVARKTYDLEVWLPGQQAYREISSCSVCGDFQARRMGARYRPAEGESPLFVHTLNGSGLAVGRTIVAIMENYQQADGSIVIPEALRPYMDGLEVISADG